MSLLTDIQDPFGGPRVAMFPNIPGPDYLTRDLDGSGFNISNVSLSPINVPAQGNKVFLTETGEDGDGAADAAMGILLKNPASGNKTGLAIRLIGVQQPGTNQFTGLAIRANTPPDNGGDSSGLYILQTGGGNAASIYNRGSEADGAHNEIGDLVHGIALELGVDGTKTCIMAIAENGIVFQGLIDGEAVGISMLPLADGDNNRRAYVVLNAAGTAEKFFVTLGGSIYGTGLQIEGAAAISGDVTVNYLGTAGGALFAMKRIVGTLNGSGAALVAHGIAAGHLKICDVKAYGKGGTAEMVPLTVDYVDGANVSVSGGTASRHYRVTIFYSKTDDGNW